MAKFDFVIFGATGFTGRKAVEEAARLAKKYGPYTWAVAGRSEGRLRSVLDEASRNVGEDLSRTEMIIADVGDEQSLREMCSRAQVLVNCCGPYQLYGEPVVRAAVDARAHYVDVSGEPQFIEGTQLALGEAARAAGVLVVSACAFDSVPSDMGVVFLQQHFDGTLHSVEAYMSMYIAPEQREEVRRSGAVNYGTWESAVHSIANLSQLKRLRQKIYPERLPAFKPTLLRRGVLHKKNGRWCVPFLGTDSSVVYRSQRTLYEEYHERPVQFKPYVKLGGFFTCLACVVGAIVVFLMSKLSFTKKLLLDYPSFFTGGMVQRNGPKEEVTKNTHFKFELYGEGWERGADVEAVKPNKKMVAVVRGVNPGYGATVTTVILGALTMLRERSRMPQGGVMTTCVAFRNTSLVEKLNDNNLTFQIVENK